MKRRFTEEQIIGILRALSADEPPAGRFPGSRGRRDGV
jgi:hypothetical protein